MNFSEMVAELIEIGDRKPMDFGEIDVNNFPKFPENQRRIFSKDGITYSLQYSVDILSNEKKCRHVSICRTDGRKVTDEMVKKIQESFFGEAFVLRFLSGLNIHLMQVLVSP